MEKDDMLLLKRVFGDGFCLSFGQNPEEKLYKVTFQTKNGEGFSVGDSLEECMRQHLDDGSHLLTCQYLDDNECWYWYEDDRPCYWACGDRRLGFCLLNLFKLE